MSDPCKEAFEKLLNLGLSEAKARGTVKTAEGISKAWPFLPEHEALAVFVLHYELFPYRRL